MEFPNNRIVHVSVAVVVIAATLLWMLVIKPARLRSQQYSGEIIEVYQRETRYSRRKRFSNPSRAAQYRYYWTIETDDGTVMDVKVNLNEWRHAEEGMPVIKVEGEIYPFIDLPEQHERRAGDRQAREMLFDTIRNR